jgi:hypothetical protein
LARYTNHARRGARSAVADDDFAEMGDAIVFHVIPSRCLVLRSGLVLLVDDKEFCAGLS